MLLVSHALIENNPFLEKVLYAVGTKIVRVATFSIGIGMTFPSYYTATTAILLGLSAVEKITFSNQLGEMLSLFSLGMQLSAKGLHIGYKVASAALLFVIPFLPDSKQDRGHTIVALVISIPYLFLLPPLK